MNPATTLFAGLGVTQIADIITWLTTWPIHSPPQNVTLAMAALVVAGGHTVAIMLGKKFGGATPAVPATPPAAPPA